MTYDKEYARDVLGADCDSCPLDRIGRFVPSAGPATCDVAYVGEAPGVQEAQAGVPFTGPSGRLLNVVNNNYGIEREKVLLTNACLCRPPSNETPARTAIAACRPRLISELRSRRTSTAVALGNSASLALLGLEGVTKLRLGPGRTSPYEALNGLRVIPTVHPAACLRQSDMFPSLVADVGKVVSEPPAWREPAVDVIDDHTSAEVWLKTQKWDDLEVVIDIECDIDKETSFDHPDRYTMLSVGFCWEDDHATVIGEVALKSEAVIEALKSALQKAKITCQNGKFDLSGLFPMLGPLELHYDTMLASYCLDERPLGHGLKAMAVEQLGAPQYDDEIKKYIGRGPAEVGDETYYGYGKIPRDILYKYNGYDVVATYRLKRLQEPRLVAGTQPSWWDDSYCGRYPFRNLRELHDHLVMLSNEVMFLELNGIKVDKPYIQDLWTMMEASCETIEDEINKILIDAGFNLINPRSPQQVKAALAFFRVQTQSTDADTLTLICEQMLEKYGDKAYEMPLYNFPEALLRYRKEHKMFSTYVKGISKRTYRSRVYPTFSLIGTTSGRPAGKNPNLLNIPRRKDIKQMFIPGKEGNVFVQADMKQAELRILAWLADEPFLRDILNDPTRDLFNELTPLLRPDLEGDAMFDKDVRVRIKAFVYGLNYGRHYSSIAQEYRMPQEEAKLMAENFFATIPNVVAWQKWVQEHVRSGRDLITPFGRHRRFYLITKENWKNVKNEAMAFLPQSTSNDVCWRAMARVRRDLRGSGAFVRNFVYDSILVDCPPDMANDVASLLDTRMVESAQELVGGYVNFATDTAIGNHWGEV